MVLTLLTMSSFVYADEYIDVSNQADKNLTGDEIQSLFSGKSIKGQTSKGFTVEYRFEKDGYLFGNSSSSTDGGTWSVKDGSFCIKFRKWNDSCPTTVAIKNGLITIGEWFTQKK